jgi:hypothetical protein
MNVMTDRRMKRLELIASLYERGWNSIEITDYLNDQGMLSPSGKAYYPKLVWVTYDKFKRRVVRSQLSDIRINALGFLLT